MGAPIPPGFILTTENFIDYVDTYDQIPDGEAESLSKSYKV